MMLIKAILAITGLTLASGSFAPQIAGKITPSELKFTFQMKDKFAGVNPKDRVKRATFIGTCTHYCNEDNTCTTQYVSGDGTISFYAGCDPDTQECYNSNEYCIDCLDVPDWNNRSDDTCGETAYYDAYYDDV